MLKEIAFIVGAAQVQSRCVLVVLAGDRRPRRQVQIRGSFGSRISSNPSTVMSRYPEDARDESFFGSLLMTARPAAMERLTIGRITVTYLPDGHGGMSYTDAFPPHRHRPGKSTKTRCS